MTAGLERARPHLLLAALCLGLALANAVRASPVEAGLWALVLGLSASALALPGRSALFGLALLLAGLAWGSARLAALDRSVLTGLVGRGGEAVVEVTAPARRGQFDVRVLVRVVRFAGRRVSEPALLELPPARSPPQGARLVLHALIEEPRGPADGFDERAWLGRQGIHVVLRGGPYRVSGHRGGIGHVADRLRRWLGRGAAPGLAGERRAVILGVVLGADEGLSQSLRARFRSSGLYHLLAVSGQNVALIAAGVLLLAWLTGAPRWLGELVVLAAIAGYVLAVGLQPSVVRAGVAGALASLAWLAARPRDRWYFLLVGAAALLAWNPYSVFDPGFQLSFAAVSSIFLLVPWIERKLEGYPIPRGLATVIAVSTACGLVTAPIVWLDFGRVPLFSVLANALAEPAVAALLGLGLVSALVHPLVPALAASIAWVNGWLAAYLAACARLVGGLPFASVSSGRALLALSAVIVLAWALIKLGLRGRRAETGLSADGKRPPEDRACAPPPP